MLSVRTSSEPTAAISFELLQSSITEKQNTNYIITYYTARKTKYAVSISNINFADEWRFNWIKNKQGANWNRLSVIRTPATRFYARKSTISIDILCKVHMNYLIYFSLMGRESIYNFFLNVSGALIERLSRSMWNHAEDITYFHTWAANMILLFTISCANHN